MASRDPDDVKELARGRGDPDLQDDILDSQQSMGLEHEERTLAEEQQLEQLDVLEGLRQMQTADPIRWKIYRYGHEESKYNGYLGELPTTSLTQETLRKKFGGGQYRVRGIFTSGKYATQRQISIAGESILFIPETTNAAAHMQPNAPFNLSEYMTAQEQRDEKRREADQRRADEEERRAERRSKENRDFILAIGAVVAPVVTALVSRASPAPVVPQAVDIAGLVTALRKDTPTENPISGMKGMLEVMTMMKELMPGGGGDAGGSELAEIIKAVAPVATPVMQALAQRQPQAAPGRTPPRTSDPTQQPSKPAPVTIEATPVVAQRPVVAPAQPAGERPTMMQASGPSQNSGVDLSAPSQPMTSQEQTMFAQLKPQVDTLVQMARDGQDAVAVGEMFYDQFLGTTAVTDDMYDQLCELFENPKTIDRLSLFNVGVKEFRPWFETLQATIIKKINDESAQSTIAAGTTHDGES
jgi:hypothetical protein